MLLCVLLTACSSAPSNVNREITPTTDTRHAVAALALEQVGADYKPGADGPNAFDGPGLIRFAYRGAGTTLSADVHDQLDAGKPIELAQARPSDLLFFRFEDAAGGDRMLVALYMQAGEMLMALPPNVNGDAGVRLVDLDSDFWQQHMVGVIRILP